MKISKKSAYFGISAFQNFKIIGLFRCHRGSPKKVEQKNIRYVFVQAKDISGQKSKIIVFFRFSDQPICSRVCGATLTVLFAVIFIIFMFGYFWFMLIFPYQILNSIGFNSFGGSSFYIIFFIF